MNIDKKAYSLLTRLRRTVLTVRLLSLQYSVPLA